jgi:hypothetical protein
MSKRLTRVGIMRIRARMVKTRALRDGATTPGERAAAETALERMTARLMEAGITRLNPNTQIRFIAPDPDAPRSHAGGRKGPTQHTRDGRRVHTTSPHDNGLHPAYQPDLRELQEASGIDPDSDGATGLMRDGHGRFTREESPDIETAMYLRWADQQAERLFGHMNPRPPKSLGWMSRRDVADARRERDRRTSCVSCGGPLPEGARSDTDTCSPKCRKRKQRNGIVFPSLAPEPGSHGYVRRLEVNMSKNTLSEAVREYTLYVWAVPMPAGYPDEAEWRLGQAEVMARLLADERASLFPSLARFRRRARAYIKHMKRLAAVQREPTPSALVKVSRQEGLRILDIIARKVSE